MDATVLRAIQAPLKLKYRDNPDTARIASHAEVVLDPTQIVNPTIVMRGEYDGIASFEDLIEFFRKLPNADKTFSVMAGISHASFQQKNYYTVYHILNAFFSQPEPVYTGAH